MKKMTRAQLIKSLCLMEGKKVQVSVGNVREVVKCLTQLETAAMISTICAGDAIHCDMVMHHGAVAPGGPLDFIRRESIKAAIAHFKKQNKKAARK